MKIRFGQCLACLVASVLGLAMELSAAEFTAKWIGTADGNWDNPANWDIGQVPNNTTTDTYDVIWDAHPIIATLTQDIAIRNFTFASGGVLKGPASRFTFTVQGDLQWTHGVLLVSGRTTVEGIATLQGAAADSLKIEGGVLFLKGRSALMSTLSCLGGGAIVNDAGAIFEAHDLSGFVSDASNTGIENLGTFRILAGTRSFPCPYFFNRGAVEVAARTVEFQAAQIFDFDQRGGKLSLDGAILKGVVAIQMGSLEGRGYIQEATVLGELSGQLTFGKLFPGNNATSIFTIGGRADGAFDRFSVDRDSFLGGTVEVRLAGGFVPEPADVFEIVTSPGGISGQFSNINFGQRLSLAGGGGSFVLDRASPEAKSIVLRDFVGGPFSLGSGALAFRLPAIEGESGGCFVGPNALINLPEGNWSGGSLNVEIVSGFDPNVDRLEFRENPGLPAGEFVINSSLDGEMAASFRGVDFGTVRMAGGRITCVFNANARNGAIIALLGHLYYSNSQLNASWFTEALARYPQRTFEFTLLDGTGSRNQLTQGVAFPHLTGIGFSEPLVTLSIHSGASDSTVNILGQFSNSQRLYVIELKTSWTSDCDPFDFLTSHKPGSQPFSTGLLKEHCSITARSGPFEASVGVLQSSCVLEFMQVLASRPPSPFALLASANTLPGISLATFHTLQSLMTESVGGKRLVDLYWRHTSEVLQILSTNAPLRDQAISIMRTFQPGVSKLLSGKGSEAPITQTMIDQLNVLWNGLANLASPGLRADLSQEQARFNNLQQFVNQEFSQWAGLLGVPAPVQPRIQISSVTWAAGRFSLEINDVGGSDFSLWRSSNLSGWELGPNVELLRSNFTLRFSDLAPPPERAFYQIRR